MKTAVILLAIVAFVSSAQIPQRYDERSISSSIVDALEAIREQMPCGFPLLGIPPLAPLKIPHKDINIDSPAFSVHGVLDNFRLNGLNDFEIADMKVNALTSKVNFRLIFNNVNVDTAYDMRMMLKKAGFTINMVGKGPAKFALKDMHIWGTIKYSIGVLSGKLKLKSLEIRTHINEVDSDIEGMLGEGLVNHKLNDVLAEAVEIAVNENEDMITNRIETAALPMINDVLDDYTLSDLVGSIGGGGGGSGEGEKESCVPPEN